MRMEGALPGPLYGSLGLINRAGRRPLSHYYEGDL